MANFRIAERKLKDGSVKKYVVADLANLTEADKVIVGLYAAQGLEIKAKSAGLTKEAMLKKAQDLDENLYKDVKAKLDANENFMKVRKYYLERVKTLKPEAKKK